MSAEGWYYEAPDPEVGIFGGGWVHEACESEDEATVEEIAVRKAGDTRITTYRLTCPCGATTEVEDEDYDPDEMPEQAFRDEEAMTVSDPAPEQGPMMCQSCGDAVTFDDSDHTWVGSNGEVSCPFSPNPAHGPIVPDDVDPDV